MKNYPREYEYVFSDKKLIDKKCKINEVSTYENVPTSVEEYQNLFHDTFCHFEKDLFDYLIKFAWLSRRFCYKGKRRRNSRQNGVHHDMAYAVFMRCFVGFDSKLIFSHACRSFTRIITYFDDFYLDFDLNNPFENKYEYPYKYMTLECLLIVFRMPERLELLKYGEEKKMKYAEFLDYIINYISCYNEEHGEKYRFLFRGSISGFPYVQKL